MKNIFFLILGIIFVSEGVAAKINLKGNHNAQEKTIPFIVEKRPPIPVDKKDMQFTNQLWPNFKTQRQETHLDTIALPSTELIKLVETFKKDICPSNKGGIFEITLKVDSSAKILGIGFSGEGGLKTIIHCDK